MITIIFYLIRFLPPETAHYITLKLLKLGFVKIIKRKILDFRNLHQVLWNIEFNNPIGLAAGFDKNGEVIDEMFEFGFGFIEIGTVTPRPQKGNEKPRVFRLNKDKAIINHLGFNNQGIDKIKRRLSKRYKNQYRNLGAVGLNISKNFDSKNVTEDYIICIKNLGIYVDYIVINVSSPNTPGLRNLQNRDRLENLIILIKKFKNLQTDLIKKPLLIKISPDIKDEQKRDIALTSLAQGIDGIIISNTTLSRPISLHDNKSSEIGGLSGKPLFLQSTLLLKEMYNFTGGKIPLIGVGGVCSGKDAYEKIKAGASLVQLYTGLVYDGPKIVNKINSELSLLLQTDGYKNITEAIGSDSL